MATSLTALLPANASITKARHGEPTFDEVLAIRATRCDPAATTDPFDAVADHYLLRENGVPIASMRVQQARRGPLDCEPFFPARFLAQFRAVTGSASRLLRANGTKANPALLRRFVAAVWRDQFEDGMRVDLINVHLPMQPYYAAMGYELVPGTWFEHPRLHTASAVMVLVADRTAATPLAASFAAAHDPAMLQLLRANLGTPSARSSA